MKDKTDLKKLESVKNICAVNGKLILTVIENRKIIVIKSDEKIYEPLHFQDEEIFYDAVDEIKNEIKTRPNPDERVESWECTDVDGVYSFNIEMALLEERKEITAVKQKKELDERALKQLCDRFNVPYSMGKLFIAELLVSENKLDYDAKEKAKILGLI